MDVSRFMPCLLAFVAILGLTGCSSTGPAPDESDRLDGVVLDSSADVLFRVDSGTHLAVQFRDGSGAAGVLSKLDAIEFTLRSDAWNGPRFTTYRIDEVERVVISDPQPSQDLKSDR